MDLRLTATVEGYRQVLVVKTPTAADNLERSPVRFTMHGTGVRVVSGPGGGVRAVDADGNATFSGPAGLMWDSTGDNETPATGKKTAKVAAGDGTEPAQEVGPDSVDGPDLDDKSAELPVRISDGSVSVVPDASLLQAASYPVYIDPPVGLSASKRTVVTSNGHHYWQFDNDYDEDNHRDRGRGVGRCSSQVTNGVGIMCASPAFTSRMFFSFSRSKLAGKIVQDATFRLTETWSFTCTPSWVNLYRTSGDISEATRWPGPSTVDLLGDRKVSHGRGSACDPDQPAAAVEFNDNPDESNENLTSTVANLAKGTWSTLTVMLRANDESDPNSWKRFKNDATLQVTYFPAPGVPTGVGVQATNDPKSVTCRDSAHAVTVADPTPPVSATVQTSVQPTSSESKGSLRAGFEVQAYDTTKKSWGKVWGQDVPGSGYAVDGTKESPQTSTLADGKSYRLHAQTVSHGSYGGKTQDPRSAFSGWCYFTVNSKAPKAPVIVPDAHGPYTECTANACAPGGGPGVKGAFTFQPDPADKDVTGYRWTLTGGKPHDVTGAAVTVSDVTPPIAGTLLLTVEAKDLPDRYGPPKVFSFKVETPSGPVGRWQFGETSGTSAADTAADGIRHPLTLATGSSFDTRARRGDTVGDHALAVDGKTGYAATSQPVVNTATSFTIAGWAYLTDTGRAQSIASQTDGAGTGFNLGYQPATGWVFDWHRAPAGQTAKIARSVAQVTATPAKVWTHIAGSYDATAKTVQLFVNGRPQGTPVPVAADLTPILTSGGLQIGRGGDTAAPGEYTGGLIDEVEVWNRALAADEIRLDAQLVGPDGTSATVLAGAWLADQGSGTSIADTSGYSRSAMTLNAGAALSEEGVVVLDGTAGYAGAAGPVVDESASFTVTARVRLDAAAIAQKPAGYLAQIAGQQSSGESSWGLWYRLDSVAAGVPQGRWFFGRTAIDGSSRVIGSGEAHSADTVDLSADPVVQVTGVYDALDDSLHLYVGEQEEIADDLPPTFPYVQRGSGELSIGRGRAGGTWGRYLPGQVGEVRMWAGAMTRKQIITQILDICTTDCDTE
ncbi:LamG domain-containing protein [Nucisporomicrobium flavum]|uniref:LamG domain-containing protein n=1 Tax=Nucisporomicrobium flavum TaxID=2785915 RepID=UPI0018F2B9CA|nr:LamG domain-containing protein [Nucisporomicrobium flavum]